MVDAPVVLGVAALSVLGLQLPFPHRLVAYIFPEVVTGLVVDSVEHGIEAPEDAVGVLQQLL